MGQLSALPRGTGDPSTPRTTEPRRPVIRIDSTINTNRLVIQRTRCYALCKTELAGQFGPIRVAYVVPQRDRARVAQGVG